MFWRKDTFVDAEHGCRNSEIRCLLALATLYFPVVSRASQEKIIDSLPKVIPALIPNPKMLLTTMSVVSTSIQRKFPQLTSYAKQNWLLPKRFPRW